MKATSIFFTFSVILLLGNYTVSAQEQVDDSKKVKIFINKKRDYNKQNGSGYRIQLYNGTENRAKSLRGKFSVEFPNIKTYLKYTSPEWKIQVGNYKTVLEADKALLEINLKFNGAIVIPIKK